MIHLGPSKRAVDVARTMFSLTYRPSEWVHFETNGVHSFLNREEHIQVSIDPRGISSLYLLVGEIFHRHSAITVDIVSRIYGGETILTMVFPWLAYLQPWRRKLWGCVQAAMQNPYINHVKDQSNSGSPGGGIVVQTAGQFGGGGGGGAHGGKGGGGGGAGGGSTMVVRNNHGATVHIGLGGAGGWGASGIAVSTPKQGLAIQALKKQLSRNTP